MTIYFMNIQFTCLYLFHSLRRTCIIRSSLWNAVVVEKYSVHKDYWCHIWKDISIQWNALFVIWLSGASQVSIKCFFLVVLHTWLGLMRICPRFYVFLPRPLYFGGGISHTLFIPLWTCLYILLCLVPIPKLKTTIYSLSIQSFIHWDFNS